MKLYTVKVEAEYVCIADDEQSAEDAARAAVEDDSFNLEYSAVPMRFLPFGWDGGEIPWPDPGNEPGDEKTVNEWIAVGAAPELTKRMAERGASPSSRDSQGHEDKGNDHG